MNDYAPEPQVYILDTGGQYTHLISRKVREQGVYAEVRPSETPLAELSNAKAVIISGGPSSVYESGSPTVDPALLASPIPVLGICYGQQLIAYLLNGDVRKGDKGEYGFANLDIGPNPGPLLRGIYNHKQVWMSHRDTVYAPPAGFREAPLPDPHRRVLTDRSDVCPPTAEAGPTRLRIASRRVRTATRPPAAPIGARATSAGR